MGTCSCSVLSVPALSFHTNHLHRPLGKRQSLLSAGQGSQVQAGGGLLSAQPSSIDAAKITPQSRQGPVLGRDVNRP